MEEVWKDINGYEGLYQVSNFGRVKSFHSMRGFIKQGEIIRKLRKNQGGYSYIQLYKKKSGKHLFVHRLVMAAFVGPLPLKHEVNHIDGNKLNNHLSNLEYCTKSENRLHCFRLGLQRRPAGEKNACAKLTADEVILIRTLHGMYSRTKAQLSRDMQVSYMTISLIIKGITWRL